MTVAIFKNHLLVGFFEDRMWESWKTVATVVTKSCRDQILGMQKTRRRSGSFSRGIMDFQNFVYKFRLHFYRSTKTFQSLSV